jgi:hypothetical protein
MAAPTEMLAKKDQRATGMMPWSSKLSKYAMTFVRALLDNITLILAMEKWQKN